MAGQEGKARPWGEAGWLESQPPSWGSDSEVSLAELQKGLGIEAGAGVVATATVLTKEVESHEDPLALVESVDGSTTVALASVNGVLDDAVLDNEVAVGDRAGGVVSGKDGTNVAFVLSVGEGDDARRFVAVSADGIRRHRFDVHDLWVDEVIERKDVGNPVDQGGETSLCHVPEW